MAWVGADLLEFAPYTPTALAVLDNRWLFSFSTNSAGPYGPGHFSILDTTNWTSRSFTLTGWTPALSGAAAADAAGGSVWLQGNSGPLFRIDASGVDTSFSPNIADGHAVVASDTWVLRTRGAAGGQLLDIATGTYTWNANITTNRVVGAHGSRLFGVQGGRFVEIDTTNGTVAANLGIPPGGLSSAVPKATRVGNRLYWATTGGAVWLDVSTGAAGNVTATPDGFSRPLNGFAAGPDGYLYGFNNATTMVVLDPDSGRWASRSFPTVRGRRYAVASVAGQIITPWGGDR